jgi:hypothetical protein
MKNAPHRTLLYADSDTGRYGTNNAIATMMTAAANAMYTLSPRYVRADT